ncbi:MAG TPA: biopolymer transporter ExbD [Chitinophagaceae bacterium]
MIEINSSDTLRARRNSSHPKKASLRIDMTPMVDLGFLLIAFFIFATELTQPTIAKLIMPHDGDSTKIADSKSMTVLLDKGDRVFYYYGQWSEARKTKAIFQTSFDEKSGLGNIIREKQLSLKNSNVDKRQLVILIKPSKNSSYKAIMNAIDEMLINGVIRYALVDPEKDEAAVLAVK